MDARKETQEWPCEAIEQVASSSECTGLLPALEDEPAEANQRALYDVHRAKHPGRMYRKK